MSTYTLGQKKEFGTFQPSVIYKDGAGVLEIVGLAMHATREDLETGMLKERYLPILAYADRVVALLNEHQP